LAPRVPHAMGEGAGEAGQRASALWLLVTGALLLLMELILLAALVPASWSEQVQQTEGVWLKAGLGEHAAAAVVARAQAWHERLFEAPGLVEASYRVIVPNAADVERAGALAPLITLPFWSWVAGRLQVIWAALSQLLQRLAMIAAWWPFLLLLLIGTAGDGWLRRRRRQAGFGYPSPLVHAYALHSLQVLALLVGLLLLLPVALPAIGVPLIGALVAVLVDILIAQAPKRL
jgi:hypothetical protein